MDQLSVDGAGAIETGINFKSGGTTYGQIYFNNVSPYDMSVMQQYSTGSLILGTNDTPRLTINADGSSVFSGAVSLSAGKDLTLSGGQLNLGTNYRVRWNNSNNFSIMSDNSNYIQFNTAGSEAFRATSNQDLCIPNGGLMVGATTAPAFDLDILDTSTASNTGAGVNIAHATQPQLRFTQTTGNYRMYLGIRTNDLIIANDSGAEKVRFEQNGNVGIGTSSALFDVLTVDDSNPKISMRDSGTERAFFEVDSSNNFVINNKSTSAMILETSDTERMRIDSSGNVLVGTTDSAPGAGDTNNGISFRAGGDAFFSKASSYAARFNRNTNDGDIVTFAKAGSNVGAISTVDGDLNIYAAAAGHKGLRFGNGYIAPTNNGTTVENNTVDLGLSTHKFKDLYLSNNMNATNAYLGNGNEIGWGGTYSQGKPTISGYNSELNFYSAGSTSGLVMKLTSGGNLLVGTTDTSLWNDNADNYGHNILGHGQYYSSTNGEINAYLNRQNSDGPILAFAKDGTAIGSIGTSGSTPYLAATTAGGVRFTYITATNAAMFPCNTTGANSDATHDIGNGSVRFRNLYLSGSSYATYVGSSGDTDTSIAFDTTNTIRMSTNGAERYRVDSGGNLLVGKTTTAFGTVGIRLEGPNGKIEATRSNNVVMDLNRLSGDGTISNFSKDGTAVGSIGVSGGNNLFISGSAANHCGLTFATNAILPTTEGSINDSLVDLGASSNKYKDLYLSGNANVGATTITANVASPLNINSSINSIVYSEIFNVNAGANAAAYFGIVTQNLANSGTIRSGMFFGSNNHLNLINGEAGGAGIVLDDNNAVTMSGTLAVTGGVYLGGTGAANKLDDYEEGTWTPTLPNGGSMTVNRALYTKIGRQVSVQFYISTINATK